MRISPAQVGEVLRYYLQETRSAPQSPRGPALRGRDSLRLSDDARQISHWVRRAQALPEVREDEIQRIRSAIERGDYQPDSALVADKIIRRLIADRALEERG